MQDVNEVEVDVCLSMFAQLPRNLTPCFRSLQKRPTSSFPYKKLQEATSPPRTPEKNPYRWPMIQPTATSNFSPPLVFPALLYWFSNSLRVFSSIILVEIRRFYVGWRGCIWIVQKTLDACQDCRHIVCRTPSILQDIQAQFARGVYVGMEHWADELDGRWFVWILFLEMHHQPKGPIFKRGVRGSDDHGIPLHDIISYWGCWYSGWWICLHTLEVSHQTAASGGRHDAGLTCSVV